MQLIRELEAAQSRLEPSKQMQLTLPCFVGTLTFKDGIVYLQVGIFASRQTLYIDYYTRR